MAMKRVYEISLSNDSDEQKRSRSLSPENVNVQPNEVVRALRNMLRDKSNEIFQANKKLKLAEKQVCKTHTTSYNISIGG